MVGRNSGWTDPLTRGSLGPAVTTYYDELIGLAGIAINALRGPQVTLDDMRLVGRNPRAWRPNSPNISCPTAETCRAPRAPIPAHRNPAWCYGRNEPATCCSAAR